MFDAVAKLHANLAFGWSAIAHILYIQLGGKVFRVSSKKEIRHPRQTQMM